MTRGEVESPAHVDGQPLYKIGPYDCTPLLDFGIFRELRDRAYFKKAQVVGGTVAWPNEQDICPDTLYVESKKGAEKELA